VIDVTSSFALNASVQLFARIDNVFDQRNEEILGYNPSGRAASAGVRVHF
jgi:outer membrane cobalamin receptor